MQKIAPDGKYTTFVHYALIKLKHQNVNAKNYGQSDRTGEIVAKGKHYECFESPSNAAF